MCFSAPASFVAGGVLSTTGVATLSKTKKKREWPFASIPLFFGIQQLAEGVVWVSFGAQTLHVVATYIFLFFANIFWPIYIPFSVLLLEKNRTRKKILSLLFLIGCGVGLYLLYSLITTPVSPVVVGQSIFYPIGIPYWGALLVFYVLATCGSCLVSSHKLIQVFGVVVFVSFIMSGVFYTQTFTSTWCYFAALLSVIVYIFFRKINKGK